jgi:hypothetical protein
MARVARVLIEFDTPELHGRTCDDIMIVLEDVRRNAASHESIRSSVDCVACPRTLASKLEHVNMVSGRSERGERGCDLRLNFPNSS